LFWINSGSFFFAKQAKLHRGSEKLLTEIKVPGQTIL